ncbi:MAG: hypothetical protein ABI600_17655 [Luteolibacter sp.]
MKNNDPTPVHEWNQPSFPLICDEGGLADGELDPASAAMRFSLSEVNAGRFPNECFGDPFRIPAFEQTGLSADEIQENVIKE